MQRTEMVNKRGVTPDGGKNNNNNDERSWLIYVLNDCRPFYSYMGWHDYRIQSRVLQVWALRMIS